MMILGLPERLLWFSCWNNADSAEESAALGISPAEGMGAEKGVARVSFTAPPLLEEGAGGLMAARARTESAPLLEPRDSCGDACRCTGCACHLELSCSPPLHRLWD